MSETEDPDIAFLASELECFKNYFENLSTPAEPGFEILKTTITDANKSLKEKIYDLQKANDDGKEALEGLLSASDQKDEASTKHQKELENILKTQDDLSEETRELPDTILQKEQQLAALREEAKKVKKDMPRIRKEYSVFAGLFPIKWDAKAPANLVKGCVVSPVNSNVVPFCLDKEENTSHFIANFLWQQMGTPDTSKFLN